MNERYPSEAARLTPAGAVTEGCGHRHKDWFGAVACAQSRGWRGVVDLVVYDRNLAPRVFTTYELLGPHLFRELPRDLIPEPRPSRAAGMCPASAP